LKKDFAMSSNWKPWWEKVSELSPSEAKEFIRGVGGAKPNTMGETILLSIIAGYVGGTVAKRTGNKK
jgi:hypothetical protein